MKVCIAEKPSVAREIASVLGARTRKDGFFEGNGYQVTWTFGHLCTLKEPEDYSPDLKRWNLTFLPIIPPKYGIKLISNKGVGKQFKVIERLVTQAEEVINCGDAGQEGELIQRWVLAKARCRKPVKRLWISSLTEEAIREGFQKLKDGKDFENLYAAGSSRAIGDWLLGINATRLYTLRYGNGKQVLSIGRVQTPTLALLVNRQKEIDNFTPETYWELKTKYRDVLFSAEKGRFSEKDKGEAVLASLQNEPFTVVSFSKKKGKEAPPKLFDLTALQVECNKKFGLSADQTLKMVQSLYEKKHVTYPRVDTTYLSNDIYPKIGGIMKALRGYDPFVQPLMGKPFRKSKKVFDDSKVTDHHAIIPTNMPPNGLGRMEEMVYDTIVRRFISVFHPDCIISKTQVIGEVKDWRFKATGKQILEPGWRIVYQGDKDAGKEEDSKEKDDDQILPEFKEGETGPHEPQLAEKQTRPPKYYTEATLLRAMETAGKQVDDDALREVMKENGIGRPSTRANIIETLFRRKYIRKTGKRLEATVTGIQLIDTIHNELLKSAELTGQWEFKLRQIEKGVYSVKDFMEEMKQMVSDIVFQVKNDRSLHRIEVVEDSKKKGKKTTVSKTVSQDELKCPKCSKGGIIKGKSAYGCAAWSDGCRFKVPFEYMGKKLTEKQVFSLIQKGKTPVIKGFEQNGDKVNGTLHFDSEYHLTLKIKDAAGKQAGKVVCPKCKEGEIVKGKSAWGCTNWKNGCRLIIPFEFNGKKLTENQMTALCKKGRTSLIKGFEGQKTEGRLILDQHYKIILT